MPRPALILLAAFLVFAAFTLYHSISSSLTPSDLIKMERAEKVVVSGRVENLKREDGLFSFYISDGNSRIRAVYDKEIQGEEVIATGDWENGTLYVRELLSKCHTDYRGG
ncbi:MAG: cytochrome c maturation protein CcmE [Archaeoglobales archaeon]|jgi:cytochrome c-type biogenesis protein CcmE|nr:cytochrome c maturation protein CcmE [Archaeoglobales archaeon]TDA29923.1 MAG: hypothetical protein DSO00_02880 [Archaeoglobi archaeon]